MTQVPRKVLLIGFGNPGRMDDGLGPELVVRLEDRSIPGLTLDSDYQLTVEDAHAVAQYDVVIFADADVSGPEPFGFRRLQPVASSGYSSHAVEPREVLALARELFDATCSAFTLGIRGYEFNAFGEELSEGAERNLVAAAEAIERIIREGTYEEAGAEEGGPAIHEGRDVTISRMVLN